jgi:mono/diheme cytochrome c family protein
LRWGPAERTFPALAGNELVNAADPTSLIHVVLTGSAMPSTKSAPTAFTMPDFAWRLSDAEIADVLTFVRTSWGNHAPTVRADEVRKMRGKLALTPSPRSR